MAIKLGDVKNRGADAIAAAGKSGGKFRAFTPQIQWKDGDEKYILFLNPVEEMPVLSIHEWIDCGVKEYGDKSFTDWGFFLSRKDPVLGEDSDPLTEKGSTPRKRVLAVAVELEPVMADTGRGRARPTGFTVKTETYTRKTDDGDEEVTTPVIGVITQAQKNFFNIVTSHDESDGPITEYPLKVKRVGGGDGTAYSFTPYFDQDIDLTGLVEHVEGVSYLSRDEDTWGELEPVLAAAEDNEEAAHLIAVALLEKRINELADLALYNEKTSGIERVESRFGNDDKKSPAARPARKTQRAKSNGDGEAEAPSTARQERFNEIKELAAKKRAGATSE